MNQINIIPPLGDRWTPNPLLVNEKPVENALWLIIISYKYTDVPNAESHAITANWMKSEEKEGRMAVWVGKELIKLNLFN